MSCSKLPQFLLWIIIFLRKGKFQIVILSLTRDDFTANIAAVELAVDRISSWTQL